MDTKKKIFVLLLLCAVVALVLDIEAEMDKVRDDSLIRFHVIANSDTLFDQSVKLKVRDAVIDEINGDLAGAASVQEAGAILKEETPSILKTADAVLAAEGCDYSAAASLGTNVFPTKSYGDLTLPAGKYNAYRIVLGDGRGKNWWCVLYPPLCFVDVTDDVAVAVTTTEDGQKQENGIVAAGGQPYQLKIKSKLLEFLSE